MERKTIYLCLAHMSEEGVEQKYVKEAFDMDCWCRNISGIRSRLNINKADNRLQRTAWNFADDCRISPRPPRGQA